MTAPGHRFADCVCGHPKLSHELELAPQCVAEKCTCLSYRPKSAVAPGGTASLTTIPTRSGFEQMLAAARRSESKRVQALGEKIRGLFDDLAARIEAESASAEARAEVARLERQLAEAKAKLRGKTGVPAAADPGEFQCAVCSKTVNSAQGLATHVTRVHKVAS